MNRIRWLRGRGGVPLSAAALAAGLRVVGVAANFAVLLVYARLLDIATFGTLSALIALAAFLSVPAVRGSDQSAIRLVAIARGDTSTCRRIIAELRRRTLLGVALCGGATVLAGGGFALAGQPSLGAAIVVSGISILPLALLRVTEGSLRGTGTVVWALLGTNVLLTTVTILATVLWAMLQADALNLVEATTTRLVGAVVASATAAALLAWRLKRSRDVDVAPAGTGRRDLAARWLMVVGVANAALTQLDVVVLALLGSATEAGLYSAAARIALSMNIALLAVNFALAPRAARLFEAGETARLQKAVTEAARGATATAGLIACVLMIFAPTVLALFGSEYSAASTALRILCVGYLVSALCGPVGTVLNMTNAQKSAGASMLLAVLIDVIGLVALVPPLGAIGAATATALAMITWNVLMAIASRRRVGVDATVFGWRVKDAG